MASLPQVDPSRMESRWLMRKSIWCGTVFGLATLLTSLNALPPVSVSYRVRSDVVLSEPRLEALKSELIRKAKGLGASELNDSTAGRLKSGELIGVKEIDRSSSRGHAAEPSGSVLTLVTVESLWQSKFESTAHDKWVKELSTPPSDSSLDSELAKEKRIAKWEVEATQHYLDYQNFLSREGEANDVNRFENDGTKDRLSQASRTKVFELASSKRESGEGSNSTLAELAASQTDKDDDIAHRSSSDGAFSEKTTNEFEPLLGLPLNQSTRENEADLLATLDAAKKRLSEREQAVAEQSSTQTGPIQFTDRRVVQSVASTIPVWMASSILILGIASGLCAGWFQHRLQSGGAFEPQFVADRLAFDGIPIAGEVSIVEDSSTESDWLEHAARRANALGRRAAVNLTRLSELTLGFWVMLMAIRLLTDPMWRSVLADSPLAAFGRILVGMP